MQYERGLNLVRSGRRSQIQLDVVGVFKLFRILSNAMKSIGLRSPHARTLLDLPRMTIPHNHGAEGDWAILCRTSPLEWRNLRVCILWIPVLQCSEKC